MHPRAIVPISLCVLALVACTTTASPTTPPTSSNGGSAPASSTGGGPGSPQADGTPVAPTVAPPVVVAKVKHPWKRGHFQTGIQLYWHTTGTAAQMQASADRTLDYIVRLGANSVGVSFPIFTDGPTPTRVYAGRDTPSPKGLGILLAAANARRLRVTLRPIIDEANIAASGGGAWRGSLEPVDRPAWFSSYDRLITSYVRVASAHHVQELVAGTELFTLQSETAEWLRLIALIKQGGYQGKISYAINWNNWSAVPFKTLGLDAYPAVDLGDDASVAELTDALTRWFEQQPLPVRSRLTIQEAGIPAQSGMYRHPWLWGTSGQLNLHIQANWFTAVCRAARASSTQGIYFWMLDSNADPATIDVSSQPSSDFLGRPAERSIKACFKA